MAMKQLFMSVSVCVCGGCCVCELFHIFIFLDHENIYSGRVFGELQSSVRAHIDNGILTASIVLPDETYHIEVPVFIFYKIIY